MNSSPLTGARIKKAIRHRLSKLKKSAAEQKPVPTLEFNSPIALCDAALLADKADSRQRFLVSVKHNLKALPVAPELRLSHIKKLNMSFDAQRLSVDVTLSETKTLGEVLWAVACIVSPALRPHAHLGPDVVTDSRELAAGQRLHLREFAGSDASEMESQHALRLTRTDVDRPVFDVTEFNPIGLRMRELSPNYQAVDYTPTIAIHDVAAVHIGPNVPAATIAGLASTGTLIRTKSPIEGLHPHLNQELTSELPPTLDDAMETSLHWMVASEKQRRAALKHHAGTFKTQNHWPLASVLLVTNRASMLSHAVAQIANQTYPNTEVLVGLHGINHEQAQDLLRNHVDFLGDRIRLVPLDGSIPLGVAYGQLTSLANGEYLAKFDDDDHYGPHHLWDAIMSLRYSGAGLFGRTPTMTWLSGTSELLLRPFGVEETYNKYIIGATMVMSKSALTDVGGWRGTPWAVDKALIDRFTAAGAGVYRGGQLGWVYVRHNQGHTWVRDEQAFRDQALACWSGAKADELKRLVLQDSQDQS